MKRVRITVTGRGYNDGWHCIPSTSHPSIRETWHDTKAKAIRYGIRLCKQLVKDGRVAQLVIKNRRGRIINEHTYPRSSDPRRYKG